MDGEIGVGSTFDVVRIAKLRGASWDDVRAGETKATDGRMEFGEEVASSNRAELEAFFDEFTSIVSISAMISSSFFNTSPTFNC